MRKEEKKLSFGPVTGKDIEALEQIQSKVLELGKDLEHTSKEWLNVFSLGKRRLRVDLVTLQLPERRMGVSLFSQEISNMTRGNSFK